APATDIISRIKLAEILKPLCILAIDMPRTSRRITRPSMKNCTAKKMVTSTFIVFSSHTIRRKERLFGCSATTGLPSMSIMAELQWWQWCASSCSFCAQKGHLFIDFFEILDFSFCHMIDHTGRKNHKDTKSKKILCVFVSLWFYSPMVFFTIVSNSGDRRVTNELSGSK